MKLYYHPASPNGRRAIVTLRQLDLKAEEIVVDLGRGGNTAPEYTRLNPNQKVPTLVDGDFVLWESNAIMQYLASKKPEAGLMPRDERGRADMLRWQCWNMNHFAPAVGTFNWENLLKRMFGGGEPDIAKLAQAEKELTRFGTVLDHHLADQRYVLGDQLTVADLSLAATLMYRVPAKVPLEPFPHLLRFIESIEALEAWKSTQPKLG
jgi:glutathione S-transferase